MGISEESSSLVGIMRATKAIRSSIGFLAILSAVEAAKVIDPSSYEVVEALPESETRKTDVKPCLDVMARNGMNFSSFAKSVSHGLHSLHLEEIGHFFEPNASKHNKVPLSTKISHLNRRSCLMLRLLATTSTSE